MTFGHGGNIYEMARMLNCRPADIVDMISLGDVVATVGMLR